MKLDDGRHEIPHFAIDLIRHALEALLGKIEDVEFHGLHQFTERAEDVPCVAEEIRGIVIHAEIRARRPHPVDGDARRISSSRAAGCHNPVGGPCEMARR